jgi:hypothetical protein
MGRATREAFAARGAIVARHSMASSAKLPRSRLLRRILNPRTARDPVSQPTPQCTRSSAYNRRWVAVHEQYGERGEEKPMNASRHSDPAERNALMRLFYRNWRPTRLGRWVNRLSGWWSGLGLPPRFQAVLEVRVRTSGRRRSNPVVNVTVEGNRYLVSMLGPESGWVKNVEAAHGDAVIRQGRRRHVQLVAVPPEQRAPLLREYVRIRRAADSTIRSPSAHRSPSSRRSPGVILCTGSIAHESGLPKQKRLPPRVTPRLPMFGASLGAPVGSRATLPQSG